MRFTMLCWGSETDLYEEVCEWLAENVAVYTLHDRDVFGLSMSPNTPMKGRTDIEIDIPDDTAAVQFKLRFAEELERQIDREAQWQSLIQSMTTQMMSSLVTTNPVSEPLTAEKLYSLKVRYAGNEPDLLVSREHYSRPSSRDMGSGEPRTRIDYHFRPRFMGLHHGSCIDIRGI